MNELKKNIIKASINTVFIHWSESTLINDELGCDNNFDINADVSFDSAEDLFNRAAKLVCGGYDKTKLTIVFNNGERLDCRIDLTPDCYSLYELISYYMDA